MRAMAKRTANGTLKLDTATYEKELFRLQAELVTMQQWVIGTGSRLVVLFDRSWYNRAGVERVMGFCSDVEYARFLRQAPSFERMLIDDGVMLRKYWFSVSDVEQEARFRSRAQDPMRRWKLSPMDMQSITRWEDYSRAKDTMMQFTDISDSPWYTVESDDKKTSRINVIAHLLSTVPYEDLHPKTVEIPSRPVAVGYHRPPRESNRYVPDHAHTLPIVTVGGKNSGKGSSKKDEGKKDGAKQHKDHGHRAGHGPDNGPASVAVTADAVEAPVVESAAVESAAPEVIEAPVAEAAVESTEN